MESFEKRSVEKNPQKLQQAKKQADEVVGILSDNIIKLADRENNLKALNETANKLQGQAHLFDDTCNQLERKTWWQSFKIKLIVAVTCILLLGIIAAWMYLSIK